jgi:UDP-N-acetylmuramoyl-L-alanyl-D-glutamate--2,6-diaminopimelate ligase
MLVSTNILRAALSRMLYGNPSHKLCLIGVTGTNGKTTTATLLWQLFESMGCKCGLISTVVYRIHDRTLPATHTTPSLLSINKLLAEMVKSGCKYCFMEVSSHAIVQRRNEGLHFQGGIFTNITHDHLDYHKTFNEYIRAKKLFFDGLPPTAFALTNHDDRNGAVMLQNCKAHKHTYALRSMADFKCRIVEQQLDGTLLNINGTEFWTPLIGNFNAYNVCSVYGTATLLMDNDDATGNDPASIIQHLSALTGAAGRFERIASPSGIVGIVDYAHTPDALQNVIDTINKLITDNGQCTMDNDPNPNSKDNYPLSIIHYPLITVVGCGGDRDRSKRPIMARIAARGSARAILTSDNPRTEQPEAILQEMVNGLSADEAKNVLVIADRRQAIKSAVALARKGDIILIAGKGHEDYQIIGTTKHHFDDKEELRQAFDIAPIVANDLNDIKD